MEFLKEILGDDLFGKVKTTIDSYNGNEANKDRQIKLANLAGGDYVGKGKYEALEAAISGKDAEISNANSLIAELKKASKGNDELQKKFVEYEQENARLQAELAQTKIKAALKVALLSEHCNDVDYMTFKLGEKLKDKGENLELDENDNIKGWANKLEGLKLQFPAMFESAVGSKDGFKVLDPNKLKQTDGREVTTTKEQFRAMSYEERVALKQKNEQLYKQLANKE